jgi:hypothetical protein
VREEARGRQTLFASEFDGLRWRELLAHADLGQRERSFDALVKRARLDPRARAFVEALAHDPAQPELAWTARLALRELGRARFLVSGLPGTDPFGTTRRMQEVMQEVMNELLLGEGPELNLLHPAPRLPGSSGPRRSTQGFWIEQDQGGARVRILETVGGEQRSRSFIGASVEEILRRNPELRGALRCLHAEGTEPRPEEGLSLSPQGKSRPRTTELLGVVVRPIGPGRARELGLEGQGLVVEQTYPETYAQLLGVGAGDVLLELDGAPLRSGADIERVMRARAPGAELTLVWLDELGQRHVRSWRPIPGREER